MDKASLLAAENGLNPISDADIAVDFGLLILTLKTIRSEYVLFIGQAVAFGLGYVITKSVANSYLNDCHQLAEAILEVKFKKTL